MEATRMRQTNSWNWYTESCIELHPERCGARAGNILFRPRLWARHLPAALRLRSGGLPGSGHQERHRRWQREEWCRGRVSRQEYHPDGVRLIVPSEQCKPHVGWHRRPQRDSPAEQGDRSQGRSSSLAMIIPPVLSAAHLRVVPPPFPVH
jgi:hypothetical protein